MRVIERGPVVRAGQWLPALPWDAVSKIAPGDVRVARGISTEFVDVPLAPVAEGPRREAGEVLDVVGEHAGPARAEQLVEVLHGFGELDRGTVLDAVLRELLGCDVVEVDGVPEEIREDLDLLPGGERLRPVEDVTVADMAILGEYERGDTRDVAGIDNGLAARAGRVDDAVLVAYPPGHDSAFDMRPFGRR
jgi:hypothetical protein